ncbi:DNA topoisomerase type IA zn finger domain protein [Methanocaldococcus vulcanius M7]|uniref:DNA topoisomerase type IA zn finger domain protein n=1 Tax=Methanocaldococcus vulcanius (strain ATCC 700851 / DSM 12094 / M7) TaxID=579137 RepID=C9RGT0_METVM|nr:topoisomerase DNA-binding C4 zinc finger domain-containing protein [Methanocaldococcus vulcanius]ACX72782.1 DNA topoisomerase type IA zn finger domain protein [Methanocaldococcus vulcanius M7]
MSVLNELFEVLSKDLHFNVSKLDSKNYDQNWKVPEGFISIIGLENAKMPVFYYGITNSYEKKFEIKKIVSPKGQKQVFARTYFIFDRRDIIEKEKYVVANAFNGLLLLIKLDKKEFIGKAVNMLTKGYEEDEFIREVLDNIKEKNMFDNIDETIRFVANRDYNWLIGRIKYNMGLLEYSGQGYYLLPIKTNMQITSGIKISNGKIIIDLENSHLFKNFIVYVDSVNNKIIYNKERLCNKNPAILDIMSKIDDNTCPWCGSKLRIVRTKKGEFLGCTNYPNCLYRRFPKK